MDGAHQDWDEVELRIVVVHGFRAAILYQGMLAEELLLAYSYLRA